MMVHGVHDADENTSKISHKAGRGYKIPRDSKILRMIDLHVEIELPKINLGCGPSRWRN